MSDEEQGSGQHPFHREGRDIIFEPPPDPKETSRQRREDEQHEFARSQVITNKKIAWFTGALVVATFCTIGVGIWQGFISQKAAKAAESAAKTAEATLKHTVANDSAASASNLTAFKQEQRAYVSYSSATMSAPPICGEAAGLTGIRACVDIHFVNTGKTPAVGIRITDIATFGEHTKDKVDKLVIPPRSQANGDLLGNVGDKWITVVTNSLSEGSAKAIVDGTERIYVYGVVQYYDIFHEYHETGFCVVRVYRSTAFSGCNFGNWFDNRPTYGK